MYIKRGGVGRKQHATSESSQYVFYYVGRRQGFCIGGWQG
ncbi:hypothetical protein GMOD_00010444 [Pyrenophora seminiperda CCB06]|uniref:Uncharacterized protein n=1 Tax=Pyrenophora seminiperda CCB06 TaxID=1302712 RepID=A0A3M7MEC0_9PLEO|nr:hypothetical protein GMOD_00010444 [Pyrenophora seminiperda CCB06]